MRQAALSALKAALSAIVTLAVEGAPPAQAGCYEGQGCTDQRVFSEGFLLSNASCETLWQIRNQI